VRSCAAAHAALGTRRTVALRVRLHGRAPRMLTRSCAPPLLPLLARHSQPRAQRDWRQRRKRACARDCVESALLAPAAARRRQPQRVERGLRRRSDCRGEPRALRRDVLPARRR
jgi:hypothetical protein